jgi:hypothetical protein
MLPQKSHRSASVSVRPRTTLASASALAVITSAIVALGSASAPAAQAATPTRQALINSADAICKASNESLLAAAKSYEKYTIAQASGAKTSKKRVAKPAEVGDFIQAVAKGQLEATISNLRLLQAPAADRKEYADLLTATEKALAVAVAKPNEAAWTDPFKTVSASYITFGFSVCGHKIGETKVKKKK